MDDPNASVRRIPPNAVLVCGCCTWWDKRAIDDYNAGDVHVAADKHKAFWKHDGHPHQLYVPLQP